MRLLGAYEDFKLRTLAKIPGLLGKAFFMRQCREMKGYRHWGMANTYGQVQGSKILRQIDHEIHLELLRTPLDELLGEMNTNPEVPAPLSASDKVDAVVLGEVGSRHLQFVCDTLNSMAASGHRNA